MNYTKLAKTLRLLADLADSAAELEGSIQREPEPQVDMPLGAQTQPSAQAQVDAPLSAQQVQRQEAPAAQTFHQQPAQGAQVIPMETVTVQGQTPQQQAYPAEQAPQAVQGTPAQGQPAMSLSEIGTYLGQLSARLSPTQQDQLGRIINKYGTRISEIDPQHYPVIMAEVKEAFNG